MRTDMRPVICLAALVSALALSAPAAAQEAEQAGGPLTLLSASSSSLMMMSPPQTEGRRTETWLWMFLREPQTVSAVTYDTLVLRVSLDCATMTGERLGVELYRDGDFVYRDPPRVTPFTAENVMGTMCERGRQAETFVDHRAARAAATRHFASAGS
jgi:hypothetical protein